MKISKNYKFNIPEFGDVADITKVSENFEKLDETVFTIDEAIKTFDVLADRYGYTYAETQPEGVTTHTETVKEGCPIKAERITTEGVDASGYDLFAIKITLGATVIQQQVTVRDTTAEMEVK